MIRKIKEQRDLTVLLTTHYMDEADKLCDRVAIVDHGKLMALDSPLTLKASVAGTTTLDASFSARPEGWLERLQTLPGVEHVTAEDHVVRIASRDGPATTLALMEASQAAAIEGQSLSIQSTTLDDVFVHYTGRQLRDALQEPSYAERIAAFRR
jgi:ABC-2 type transport system ATP-binding protein